MPTPKLFKKFSSKSSASESNSALDVPANDEKEDESQTIAVTSDGPVPESSDDLEEAWKAAHQELPQAQGAENFLNKIGMSIIPTRSAPPARGDRRYVSVIER